MAVVIDGTNGINTPDLESAGPVTGTTGTFSGNVTLGSSVLATPSGSAPAYLCRAWVNFNGTGTVAIRASGNVSSITDNGTGDYTVNFTTAMPDANYSTTGMTSTDNITQTVMAIQGTNAAQTTAGVRFFITGGISTAADRTLINVAIFR